MALYQHVPAARVPNAFKELAKCWVVWDSASHPLVDNKCHFVYDGKYGSERVLIVSGKATIKPDDDSPSTEVQTGDAVYVFRGFSCHWVIHEPLIMRRGYFGVDGKQIAQLQIAATREDAVAALQTLLHIQQNRDVGCEAGAILEVMQKFNSEGDILALACEAWVRFVFGPDLDPGRSHSVDGDVRRAAPPILLNAMNTHLMHAKLQQHAAAALWRLANDDAELSVAMRDAAVSAGTAVLRAHRNEGANQASFNCLCLIAMLCTQYEASCPNARREAVVSVADAGALGAIVEVIECFLLSSKRISALPLRVRGSGITAPNYSYVTNLVQDIVQMRFDAVERLEPLQMHSLCRYLCLGCGDTESRAELLAIIKRFNLDASKDYEPSEDDDSDEDEDEDELIDEDEVTAHHHQSCLFLVERGYDSLVNREPVAEGPGRALPCRALPIVAMWWWWR